MTEEDASSLRRAKARTALRWGFPLVTFTTTIIAQVMVPRVLQMRLSQGEYVAYVAVLAAVAYLSLADGGLLLSVMREMSESHGRGDRETFAAEVYRARRVFAGTALLGALIGALAIGSAVAAATGAWAGAANPWFLAAVSAVLVATCLNIGFGSYHTALLFSTGRLLAGQVVGLAVVVAPLAVLIAALLITRSLAIALAAQASTVALAAACRGLHARRVFRREVQGTKPGRTLNSLSKVVGAGVAIKAADILPNAVFPHTLSLMAPDQVPAAIPARILCNGTRMISQQFMNLLQVHVTRRLAGDEQARQRGAREYRLAATFLTGAHLSQLAVAAGLAQPIFELWLPMHATTIELYLPGMLAEQALLSAAMPASVFFAATGRLGTLGIVKIIGVLAGLLVLVLTLSHAPQAAFGFGLAVSAVPLFLLGLYVELFGRMDSPAPDVWAFLRYAASLAAAVAALAYAHLPAVTVVVLGVGGVMLLPRAGLRLAKEFLGRASDPTSD